MASSVDRRAVFANQCGARFSSPGAPARRRPWPGWPAASPAPGTRSGSGRTGRVAAAAARASIAGGAGASRAARTSNTRPTARLPPAKEKQNRGRRAGRGAGRLTCQSPRPLRCCPRPPCGRAGGAGAAASWPSAAAAAAWPSADAAAAACCCCWRLLLRLTGPSGICRHCAAPKRKATPRFAPLLPLAQRAPHNQA